MPNYPLAALFLNCVALILLLCLSDDDSKRDLASSLTHAGFPNGKKVIVMAYPRSGSSFTGAVLGASAGSFYLYEPLWSLQQHYNYSKVWLQGARMTELVTRLMPQFLYCGTEGMAEVQRHWQRFCHKGCYRWRNVQDSCLESTLRIVKTIRLHRNVIKNWLQDSDIKVIHLVRDPRGILNSLRHQMDTWKKYLVNFKSICEKIEDDMQLEQELPPERYLRIRYEDLARTPINVIKSMYSFIGLEFTSAVEAFVEDRTSFDVSKEAPPDTPESVYFSIFRGKDFAPNQWTKELGRQVNGVVDRSSLT